MNHLLSNQWNWSPIEYSQDYFGDEYAMLHDAKSDVGITWPTLRPTQATAFRLSTGESCNEPEWVQLAQHVAAGKI